MPRSHPTRPSLAAAALAAVALLASAACGGDDDVSRDTFRDDLQERTTIPEDVAGCITDGVFEAFGQEDVNEIYRAEDEDDLGEDRVATLNDINQRCWAEDGSGGGDGSEGADEPEGTDDGSDDTTTTAGG